MNFENADQGMEHSLNGSRLNPYTQGPGSGTSFGVITTVATSVDATAAASQQTTEALSPEWQEWKSVAESRAKQF
jgi:hypothetical protein